ncbi:DUF3108 domain-containing protein [Pelomonas sp. V22]|uniref:DUF3108 domain-containing protein n=1 Tax=Pelomonas sp. V22 TaxID=2822139 RepID=UPI0024A7DF12|nr:DUF3108 domain-containing protein [Pelomonas sp. V22]MDI4632541.1 DUF3108 domain-containing protein [Pelomonas sp. V22]
MAGRLSRPALRRWAFVALLLLVLCLHWRLIDEVQALHQRWAEMEAMPPRLQVAFVRELRVAAPPAVKAVRTPLPQSTPGVAPALPAAGASAPSLDAPLADELPVPAPLSAPELLALPASAVAAAPVPASSPASAVASDEPGPEWPASTRLSYSLFGYRGGDVHGDAQVEWMRQGRRYQVHLDVGIGPRLAPLVSRRMSSEGELGARGISPRRFDEETRVLFLERRRASLLFQRGQVQLANGRSEVAPAEVQDASSQFVQLTWLFLTGRETARPGHQVLIPLALPNRQYPGWRYQVVGEETIDTPMGALPTWHLRPVQPVVGGDFSVEMWLAPSLQWLPVRLFIRQDEKTWVDLLLKGPPLQSAAPEPIVQPTPKENPR